MSELNPVFQFEIIKDFRKLININYEWNKLLENSLSKHPFLTFEWLSSWWKIFGENKELFVILIKHNGDLVCIAPLMKKKSNFKIIEFIGRGRSDYLDLIISQGINKDNLINSLFRFLINNPCEWDVLHLRDVLLTDLDCGIYQGNALKYGLYFRKLKDTNCAFFPMRGGFEDYIGGLSKKPRRNLRKLGREFDKNNEIEIVNDIRDLSGEGIYDIVSKIESKSWKMNVGNPRLIGTQAHRFFIDIFKKFKEKGWLEVWILKFRHIPIAYSIGFLFANKIYYYNMAFNKNYARISPGAGLTYFSIQNAFNRKIAEYDFMRGDETYKLMWTKKNRTLFQFVIHKRNLKSRICFLLVIKIRWILRRYSFFKKVYALMVKSKFKIKSMLIAKKRIK